ncbi:MAG: putative porin [Saprospiraceae bacterium]
MFDRRLRIFFISFIIIQKLFFLELSAQKVDSIALALKKTSDSILSIRLELIKRNNYEPIETVDSNTYLIEPLFFFGKSTLNNYGSPIYTKREGLTFQPRFNSGFRSLDFFYREIEELNFYKSNKTYVELMVSEGAFFANSTGGLIDNLNASAFVSKNFAHHIDLNVVYDRINQKGIYDNSRNLLGRLSTTIQYQNPESRWTYSVSYINQIFKLGNSSGIVSDSVLGLPNFKIRESVKVNSSFASTSIRNNQYFGTVSFRFKKDSSLINPKLYLGIGYKSYFNVMSDPTINNSKAFYGRPFLIDSSSLNRAYVQYSNPIDVGISILQSKYWKLDISDRYESAHLVIDSTYKSDVKLNLVALNLMWTKENNAIQLNYKIKHQEDYVGNHFQIQYSNSFFNKYYLSLNFNILNEIPSLLDQELYINKKRIWSNKFKNTNQQSVDIEVKSKLKYLPKLQLDLAKIKNLIFLDSNFVMNQDSHNLSFIKFEIKEDLTWNNIGTEHRFKIIRLSPDREGWSTWYSRHELYGLLYFSQKTIRTKITAYAEFLKVDQVYGFNSIVGDFFTYKHNNEIFGPFVGLSLDSQISDLNVSINFDHLDSFWNSKRPSVIKGYPIYDFGFRIQLLWKFFN